jgi:chromosome partitioning protein
LYRNYGKIISKKGYKLVIALYNIKGGVGKTSTTINLAYNAAKNDKVLVWDLDPQGASTFYLEKKVKNKNLVQKMATKGLQKYIKHTNFNNIDLIPADLSLKDLDKYLEDDKLFKKLLKSIIGYKYIFIDSPPTLSPISQNIFKASDVVVIPTIPTILSIRTYNQIVNYFKNYTQKRKVFTFLSMVDKRKKMHLEISKKILSLPKKQILKTPIYNSVIVEKMGEELAPVEVFAPYSEASKAYQTLWKEIETKIH